MPAPWESAADTSSGLEHLVVDLARGAAIRDTLLGVSRAVAAGGSLADVLDEIARHATRLLGARTARVALPGDAAIATATADDVVVSEREARVPLRADGEILGALVVERDDAGWWSDEDVALLRFLAEHAAGAVRAAQLVAAKDEQIRALHRLVRGLREQTHEHANRLHTIRGLLALGDAADAERFVTALTDVHEATRAAVTERIHDRTLAGLLLAELTIARQRGIPIELADDSHVDAIPTVTESQLVTIVGNLLDNAVDAVAELAPDERRIVVRCVQDSGGTELSVTDTGPGMPEAARARALERGFTTKDGHDGVGLALVADVVRAAGGRVEIASRPGETRVVVVIPH